MIFRQMYADQCGKANKGTIDDHFFSIQVLKLEVVVIIAAVRLASAP